MVLEQSMKTNIMLAILLLHSDTMPATPLLHSNLKSMSNAIPSSLLLHIKVIVLTQQMTWLTVAWKLSK